MTGRDAPGRDALREVMLLAGELERQQAYLLQSVPRHLQLIARILQVLEARQQDKAEDAAAILAEAVNEFQAHMAWLKGLREGKDPRE